MKRKLIVSISALILTAALVLTAAIMPASVTAINSGAIGGANAETQYDFQKAGFKNSLDYLLDRDGFLYMIDHNWSGDLGTYANDLGDNHILGLPSMFSKDNIVRNFYNIKALGFNATNWWSMGHMQGVQFDENGIAVSLDENYKENLRTVFEVAREVGLCVIPTVSNHDKIGYDMAMDPWTLNRKYARFEYDKEAQDAWFENVIEPICEIYADYPDVIPCVAIGIENMSGMLDDYDLGFFIQGGITGTTLEIYGAFYNRLVDTVHKYMPNTPTSIEQGGSLLDQGTWLRLWERMFLQNKLKVDLVGQNWYHSEGSMDTRNEGFLDRPGYVGEFDVGEAGANSNVTEEVYMRKQFRSFHEAHNNGWIGASHFMYINSRVTYGGGGSLSNYETFRPFLVNWGYDIQDQINTYKNKNATGNEVAKPLFYQGGQNIYWIPARGTQSCDVERTKDGGATWKKVATNVNHIDLVIDNGLCKYVDESTVSGDTYAYRITTHFETGADTTSIATNEQLYYIPPNLVADPGFESGALGTDYITGWVTDGAQPEYSFTTEKVHSGEYSLKLDTTESIEHYRTIYTKLDCEEGKTYSFSYWYAGQGSYDVKNDYNEPISVSFWGRKKGGTIVATFRQSTTNADWAETKFNSRIGDQEDVCARIMSGTGNHKVIGYFDDFDVREVR